MKMYIFIWDVCYVTVVAPCSSAAAEVMRDTYPQNIKWQDNRLVYDWGDGAIQPISYREIDISKSGVVKELSGAKG